MCKTNLRRFALCFKVDTARKRLCSIHHGNYCSWPLLFACLRSTVVGQVSFDQLVRAVTPPARQGWSSTWRAVALIYRPVNSKGLQTAGLNLPLFFNLFFPHIPTAQNYTSFSHSLHFKRFLIPSLSVFFLYIFFFFESVH